MDHTNGENILGPSAHDQTQVALQAAKELGREGTACRELQMKQIRLPVAAALVSRQNIKVEP